MTSHKLSLASLAATLALVSGCQLPADDVGSTRLAIDECPTWGCGSNIDGMPVETLNLDGLVNESGFRLVSFRGPDGKPYDLEVDNGQLVGIDPSTGDAVLVGDDVIGSVIGLSLDGEPYFVHVLDHEAELPYWGSRPGVMSAYDLVFTSSVSPEAKQLCDKTLPGVEAIDWIGYETYALVIGGELYDGETKSVTGWDDRWFNIACAGSALAKMKRLGYDPETPSSSSYYTTPDQRQATLKMITADYCGTGHSFTHLGEPLAWANLAAWHQVDPNSVLSMEAMWTPQGAACLDVTRISAIDEPNLLGDIIQECGYTPESCGSAQEPPDLEWMTYNPDNAI